MIVVACVRSAGARGALTSEVAGRLMIGSSSASSLLNVAARAGLVQKILVRPKPGQSGFKARWYAAGMRLPGDAIPPRVRRPTPYIDRCSTEPQPGDGYSSAPTLDDAAAARWSNLMAGRRYEDGPRTIARGRVSSPEPALRGGSSLSWIVR